MATPVQEEVVTQRQAVAVEDSPEFRKEAEDRCQEDNNDEGLQALLAGARLWKVRSFAKCYYRKFYLDTDFEYLRYEPSHKNKCRARHGYIVQLSEILDVRRGWKTDTFNRFGSKVVDAQRKMRDGKLYLLRQSLRNADGLVEDHVKVLVDEARCFSIVYGENRCSLDLVAESPQVADVWVRALRKAVSSWRGLNQEKRFTMWLVGQFNDADRDGSGTLNFDEVLGLLHQLNVNMTKKDALHMFNLADTNKTTDPSGEPSLDAEEFVHFYLLLMKRPEVEELYHRYARSAKEMTCEELVHFLKKEQGMTNVTEEDGRLYIDAYERSEIKAAGRISILGFTILLHAEEFKVMNSLHKTVYQDMTQPLSSYNIATSHNTYLLGRQVVADSTMEGYVEALRRGCRCLELDCWDGSDGEPVVMHGYALTSKLIFREILSDAILPNAFVCSEYPIILSLENHCTPAQQKRLAFHLADVFGDLLYMEDVSPDMETLPSPSDLKRRILVKGRKVAPVQAPESESDDDDEMDTLSPHRGVRGVNGTGKKSYDSSSDSDTSRSPSRPSSPNLSASKSAGLKSSPARNKSPARGKSAGRSAQLEKVTDQSLSGLVNVCQGVHFHGFQAEGKCYEMVSISESKATKLLERDGEDFVRFNTRRLSKIYPAGSRTDSSNFEPWPFWNVGSQIVALNYQGRGEPVFINEAKFRDNGGCGYVLKPDFLRLPDFAKYSYLPTATSTNQLQGLKDRRRLFQIRVMSGQNLPRYIEEEKTDILDPYVEIKIIGHPMDESKQKTHVIPDNGFNPRWDCTFQFVVNLPELAFISFTVRDQTTQRHDPIVGLYALPLTSVAPGYRHVPLFDKKRRPLEPATLFIHTKMTQLVG